MRSRCCSRMAQIALILACPLLLGGSDDLASRRQRVLAMTPADQARLAENRDQFDKLDKAEQARIRQLCRDIEQDANPEQLRQTMHRYCQWLETLPSNTRLELFDMSSDQWLARVKELKQESRDEQGLRRWLKNNGPRLVQQIFQNPPTPGIRPDRNARRPDFGRSGPDRIQRLCSSLTAEDLVNLRGELSHDTALELEKLPLDEQRRRVAKLIGDMLKEEGIDRWLSRFQPDVTDEELSKYFEELTAEQRDTLLAKPGKEMLNNLRVLYHQSRPGAGFPRGGPGPDGPRRDHSSRPPGPPPDHSDNLPR
jgi:hypothetical protein